jgi:hypothetical protein
MTARGAPKGDPVLLDFNHGPIGVTRTAINEQTVVPVSSV